MFNKKWIRNAVVAVGLLITFLMIAANTIQVRENPTFLEKGCALRQVLSKTCFAQSMTDLTVY